MNKDLKEVRESAIWIAGGKAFQTEGRASTNALRQEHDWHVPGTAKSPARLEQSEK